LCNLKGTAMQQDLDEGNRLLQSALSAVRSRMSLSIASVRSAMPPTCLRHLC
jgi:hypothetical protein